MIAISIVSHGHGGMVTRLVESLLRFPQIEQILVTFNVAESLPFPADTRLFFIQNNKPSGFGANHNAAFRQCTQPFFCVLNPDIQLLDDPFAGLIAALMSSNSALAAPLVLNPNGDAEDNFRRFPGFSTLTSKLLGGYDGRYEVGIGDADFQPEWVAGMFMIFRSEAFSGLGGFDEKFFMYYEDVDICARLWKAQMKVLACPKVQVIHDAQRHSRRNLRFMRWHLFSMARYFWLHWGDLPLIRPAN